MRNRAARLAQERRHQRSEKSRVYVIKEHEARVQNTQAAAEEAIGAMDVLRGKLTEKEEEEDRTEEAARQAHLQLTTTRRKEAAVMLQQQADRANARAQVPHGSTHYVAARQAANSASVTHARPSRSTRMSAGPAMRRREVASPRTWTQGEPRRQHSSLRSAGRQGMLECLTASRRRRC
jgi:type IV secretory pathway VirJ component